MRQSVDPADARSLPQRKDRDAPDQVTGFEGLREVVLESCSQDARPVLGAGVRRQGRGRDATALLGRQPRKPWDLIG